LSAQKARVGLQTEIPSSSGRYDVVVVGAGPVGLAAAIELGRRGVRCLVIERNDRVGYAPRAKTTNVRTRTHLRRWGVAGRLAERSPFGVDYPSDVHFVTRLAGPSLAVFPDAFNAGPARHPDYPEHAQWIPQYALEWVLRDHASALETVTLRFNTEFVSCRSQRDGVEVALRDVAAGREETIEAAFLIGADGAKSTVRDAIGAVMGGRYGLSRNYNIVFRAPGLAAAHAHGPGIMYWQVNGDAPSVIGPMDQDDIWFFMPTGVGSEATLSPSEAAALIARATGVPGDYEILSSDLWVASRLIADRYRDGRVFLAGDACHLHPPFGGYGMNMGVADAVDLGWKLAAVLQGWGGEALLASYEVERKPVHEWIMDEAEANHAVLSNQLWSEGLEDAGPDGERRRADLGQRIRRDKRREFHTLGAVLGACYGPSPLIVGEGPAPAADPITYRPTSRPGCLAPHLWLDADRSLYDLFGAGFALLTRDGGADPVIAEAEALGVPLQVVALPAEAAERYPCALTLVRPDQHVAWRGESWRAGTLAQAAGIAAADIIRQASAEVVR